MNKLEILAIRGTILREMDIYVRDIIGDEDVTEYWLMVGLPDGYTNDDLFEITQDENLFNYICDKFAWIINNN